jgi:prepilin-type N-terminal cleavage/methylation domain-containing protein
MTVPQAAICGSAIERRKIMRKKGFTLVELLVVIAIIAMLLAILMPALNRVKQLAYRLVCGTNLGGLGKAIVTYSNDYGEQYPVAGERTNHWGNEYKYYPTWDTVVSSTTRPSNTQTVNITSSLYLLVKYAEVSTGTFVCKATDQKKFELLTGTGAVTTELNYTANISDVAQAWDFGKFGAVNAGGPWDYCSYSYQMPYKVSTGNTGAGSTPMGLTATSTSGVAVMADASPWYARGQKVTATTTSPPTAGPYLLQSTDFSDTTAKRDVVRWANSANHANEGQNVLFNDAHVNFESTPCCGVEKDNIYTAWRANIPENPEPQDKQGGVEPQGFSSASNDISQSVDDSFLAN